MHSHFRVFEDHHKDIDRPIPKALEAGDGLLLLAQPQPSQLRDTRRYWTDQCCRRNSRQHIDQGIDADTGIPMAQRLSVEDGEDGNEDGERDSGEAPSQKFQCPGLFNQAGPQR